VILIAVRIQNKTKSVIVVHYLPVLEKDCQFTWQPNNSGASIQSFVWPDCIQGTEQGHQVAFLAKINGWVSLGVPNLSR